VTENGKDQAGFSCFLICRKVTLSRNLKEEPKDFSAYSFAISGVCYNMIEFSVCRGPVN
jgi:hypothetical protein